MSHPVSKAGEVVAPALAPLFANIVVAVGGAVTGWATIGTRFQRVHRFRTDTVGGETSFRLLYVLPQVLNGLLFLGLIAVAAIATIGGLMTSAVPGISVPGAASPFGRIAVGFYELGWWVVVLGAAVGGIAVMDIIARLAIRSMRMLSWLPIPGIEGRFGPDGRSLGWHQAREFVRAAGAALPLAIDSLGIQRAAEAVYAHITDTGFGGQHRAPAPIGSPAACGNIALFGCIIEQLETDLAQPRSRLDIFYGAFGKLNEATSFFEPASLAAIADGKAFYSALRGNMDPLLTVDGQPALPGGPTAHDAVGRAFERLKTKYKSDVTRMSVRRPIGFSSKSYGLLRRARGFPKLDDDSMGPQFVKLCLRFGAVRVALKDQLNPPFAPTIGWYLLDLDALTALQEMKNVPFRGQMNRPAVRIAELRILKVVADWLENSLDKAPALKKAVANMGPEKRRWYLEQEADTALWSVAKTEIGAARTANWAGHRWKLDDLIATRV